MSNNNEGEQNYGEAVKKGIIERADKLNAEIKEARLSIKMNIFFAAVFFLLSVFGVVIGATLTLVPCLLGIIWVSYQGWCRHKFLEKAEGSENDELQRFAKIFRNEDVVREEFYMKVFRKQYPVEN